MDNQYEVEENENKPIVEKRENQLNEDIYHNQQTQNADDLNTDKNHKKRRNKSDNEGRVYTCPDCSKSYLSGPALTTHRKIKHNYICPNSRIKGKTQDKNSDNLGTSDGKIMSENEFKEYFNIESRRPPSMDQYINDKTITLEILNQLISELYNQSKDTLFKDIQNIQEYTFTKILIKNWDKENELIIDDSKSDIEKLDNILFKYLRDFSKKTNQTYFGFMMKFIFVLRESYIKLSSVTSKLSINELPDYFNNFYFDYFEPNKFYGQDSTELCHLILHFGYWMHLNKYTDLNLGMYKQ